MPNDIVAVPAIAYARGAVSVFRGDTPARSVVPSGSNYSSGSLDWTPTYCIENKKNGEACRAGPVKGEERCVGHKRAWLARQADYGE